MSEKEYAPLSSACVRALHDKLYEKRKTAALEIEKYNIYENHMLLKLHLKIYILEWSGNFIM